MIEEAVAVVNLNPIPAWANQVVGWGTLLALFYFAPRSNPFIMVGESLERHPLIRRTFSIPLLMIVLGVMMLLVNPLLVPSASAYVGGFLLRSGLFIGGFISVVLAHIDWRERAAFEYKEPVSTQPENACGTRKQ
jgi:hypothetical protein